MIMIISEELSRKRVYRFHYRMIVNYDNDSTVVLSFTTKSQINVHKSSVPTKMLMAANTIAHTCDENNEDLCPTGYILELIRKELLS